MPSVRAVVLRRGQMPDTNLEGKKFAEFFHFLHFSNTPVTQARSVELSKVGLAYYRRLQ